MQSWKIEKIDWVLNFTKTWKVLNGRKFEITSFKAFLYSLSNFLDALFAKFSRRSRVIRGSEIYNTAPSWRGVTLSFDCSIARRTDFITDGLSLKSTETNSGFSNLIRPRVFNLYCCKLYFDKVNLTSFKTYP